MIVCNWNFDIKYDVGGFFLTKINYIHSIKLIEYIAKKQKGWICEQTHNIHVNNIKRQSAKAYTYNYIEVSGISMSPDLQCWWRQICTGSKLI